MTSRDNNKTAKLNQIVQNFFSKACQVVVESRVQTGSSGTRGTRINKWFNLELEESESFRDELKVWKNASVIEPPPPMVIETYLDVGSLGPHQSLVLVDGKNHWNAMRSGQKRNEIVLERWIVEFVPPQASKSGLSSGSSGSGSSTVPVELPVVYKKAIILFRSLYAYCRLLPVYALRRKLFKSKLNVSPMAIGCRVLNGAHAISSKGRIGLTRPIVESSDPHLETFSFTEVDTDAGSLKLSVSYRINCDFRVSDSETVLTSHFLSMDSSSSSSHRQPPQGTPPVVSSFGSTVSARRPSYSGHHISKFENPSRTSIDQVSYSPPGSTLQQQRRSSASSSKSAFRSSPEDIKHTPFIQPFKSPSLSASPSSESTISARPPSSSRLSSNTSLAAVRAYQQQTAAAAASAASAATTGTSIQHGGFVSSSGSSGSVPKYSSSFGNRTRSGSMTSGRTSRPTSFVGEPSSVGSNSSSATMEPASGLYVDDDDLGDFVKMVDSARLLRSSRSDHSSSSSLTRQHSPTRGDPLAKFQLLRSNHAALSDSLQSSAYLGKPGEVMTASSSQTTAAQLSSSPHKSGNTHTPAVPSRLSEEFTPQEHQKREYQVRPRRFSSKGSFDSTRSGEDATGTSPLDIPTVTRRMLGREPSLSFGTTRTQGYEDLHAELDLESRRQSYDPRDVTLRRPPPQQSQLSQQPLHQLRERPSDLSSKASSRQRFSFAMPDEEQVPVPSVAPIDPCDEVDDDDLLFAMSDMHVTGKNNSN
ncbi:hypothetical protein TRVA0_058S00562 [Trichomonascus vanleenenianus]|uniref:serine/threonine protein kinase regulatory subunit ATG13 n=1 Tax=Trichomonascus vanleenenianus TaxID=2268995 RepID=UPI003EC97544